MKLFLSFVYFLCIFSTTVKLSTLPSNRIYRGWEVPIEKYPFIVSLYGCGGTILAPKWILTAKHCEYGNPRITYGESNCCTKSNNTIDVDARFVFNYSRFDVGARNKIVEDLSLLRVKQEIPFSNKAQAVKLPEFLSEIPGGTPVSILGWGLTEHGNRSKMLRQTIIETVNQEDCAKSWNSSELSKKWVLCARSVEGRDKCTGDSGGPAFTSDGTLVGVVSFRTTEACAHPKRPGAFMKVSYFIDQIEQFSGLKRNSNGFLDVPIEIS